MTFRLDFTINTAHVLLLIGLIIIYFALRKMTNIATRMTTMHADEMLRDTQYEEKDIIKHLDYIITEAIDNYELFNIRPKNIFYINSKIEDDILATISEQVSNRISKTLMVQLSFIYSNEYIGEFIGSHIHLMVTEYVINFNTNSAMNDRIPDNATSTQETNV